MIVEPVSCCQITDGLIALHRREPSLIHGDLKARASEQGTLLTNVD